MNGISKQKEIPQVSFDLTTGSDRVQASVASARSLDSGGEQSVVSCEGISQEGSTSSFALTPAKLTVLGKGLEPPPYPHRSCSEGDITRVGVRHQTPQYNKMGEMLKKLSEFIGPRHNVHKEIKTLVAGIQTVYNRLGAELELVSHGTQTTPTIEKRCPREPPITPAPIQAHLQGGQNGPNSKKRKVQSPPGFQLSQRRLHSEGKVPAKTVRSTEKASDADTRMEIEEITPGPPARNTVPDQRKPRGKQPRNEDQEWVKVENKKTKKKSKRRKTNKGRKKGLPPNALVLHKVQDAVSYADIIQKVKTDPTLKQVGEKVKKIRRTTTGNVLILFGKTSETDMETYRASIEISLKDEASVATRIPKAEIEVRDLDEWATKKDVVDLLNTHIPDLNGLTEEAVKSLRKGWALTQTAVVCLPAVHARKAAALGRIKVGWGTVRIREKLSPTRCYKCWHFGHKALDCRKRVERRKTCFRCGQEGHNATTCKEPPNCILCREKNPGSDCNHTAGGWKCPIFQNARRAALTAENESSPT